MENSVEDETPAMGSTSPESGAWQEASEVNSAPLRTVRMIRHPTFPCTLGPNRTRNLDFMTPMSEERPPCPFIPHSEQGVTLFGANLRAYLRGPDGMGLKLC